MQPVVVNTSPGAKYAGSTRPFQGIPSIAVTPGGRLWAVWFGGGPGENNENYVLAVTSDDHGRNWSDEVLVLDPPGNSRAFDPSIWVDPKGRLWIFWGQSYNWYDGRAGVWAIVTDDPESAHPTWSAPKRLCHGVMLNEPRVLSMGEWVLPVAQWSPVMKKQFRYHPDVPKDHYLSNMFVSTDEGINWTWRGGADVPERGHDEHHIIEKRDGSLWMLVRTRYGIGQSHSTDRGYTWSAGTPSGIENPTARFYLGRLQSGRLLLVKNGPIDKRLTRKQMTAYLSDDDGKTWSNGLVLDPRDEVSYPDAAEDANGRLYVIYDRSRYMQMEILAASFTEEDVLAGKIVSQNSTLSMIVNKATGPPTPVVLSPAGGDFQSKVSVKVTYPIHGPALYYTLDGTTPTRKSKRYTEEVQLNRSAVFKAKAIGGPGGQHQSPVVEAKFVIDVNSENDEGK